MNGRTHDKLQVSDLDQLQRIIYQQLIELDGVHPENALVLASHLDAEDPACRLVDWSNHFVTASEFSGLLGTTRGWISTAARLADKPMFSPSIVKTSRRRTVRMWTMARAVFISEGA